MCADPITSIPQLQAGTIKAYAIGANERNPVLPNLPTAREAGLPAFEVQSWHALFAPKGTPKPVLDKLTVALDQALDDENTRKRLLDTGGGPPAQEKPGQPAVARLAKEQRPALDTHPHAAK